ncbi:hypothetical protein G6F46_015802 [Rhizopus delemar]|nr:hypothetical protein G6F46_015802 [Rhizopus delemar]
MSAPLPGAGSLQNLLIAAGQPEVLVAADAFRAFSAFCPARPSAGRPSSRCAACKAWRVRAPIMPSGSPPS